MIKMKKRCIKCGRFNNLNKLGICSKCFKVNIYVDTDDIAQFVVKLNGDTYQCDGWYSQKTQEYNVCIGRDKKAYNMIHYYLTNNAKRHVTLVKWSMENE